MNSLKAINFFYKKYYINLCIIYLNIFLKFDVYKFEICLYFFGNVFDLNLNIGITFANFKLFEWLFFKCLDINTKIIGDTKLFIF